MDVSVRRSEPIPGEVESILRDLPDWFGIEEAIVDYVDQARTLPTWAARTGGAHVQGVCLVRDHGPHSAEIQLLAVRPERHRQGIGRALLEAAEDERRRAGVAFMQVKTLGPSDPSPEYGATRRFYQALGYRALEEFDADTLWSGNACLLMVKAL